MIESCKLPGNLEHLSHQLEPVVVNAESLENYLRKHPEDYDYYRDLAESFGIPQIAVAVTDEQLLGAVTK